jgi:hypothetical protein
MPTASWFVTALEARNNIRKDIAVHGEICAIEREVLQAVWRGDYETVVNRSNMTAESELSNEVFTVDSDTNTLFVSDHGYSTGDQVTVSSTGQLPPPLQSLCVYYVIVVDADHIRLATSRALALAGRSISIDITLGVTSVIVTQSGSGYLSPPGVRPQGGEPQTPATLQAVLQRSGAAHSVSVLNAGGAFTDAPQTQVLSVGSGATAGDVFFKVVQAQVNTGGTGYAVDDLLFLSGGDGVSAVFRVAQTVNGAVTQVIIEQAGAYVVLPTLLAAPITSDQEGFGCTLNLSMGITQIDVQSAGTGYVNPPLITITGGGGVGAAATATINAGTVSQIVITQSGSGYTSTPAVSLTTGAGAQAQAQLQPTGVGAISVTDAGSTFTDVPQVVLNSRGIDATAHSVTLKVVGTQLINGGVNYSQGDLLLVSGGAYSQACVIQVLTTNLAGQILTFNIVNPGSYTAPPVLDFNNVLGGTGVGASFNLSLGVNTIQVLTGGVGYVAPPHVRIQGDGVGAQALSQTDGDQVISIQVTASGSGYRSVPTVTLDSGTGAQAVATLLPTSVDIIQVLNPGSGYVSAPEVILQGGGGQGATAEAIIVDGGVDQIIVTNGGQDYTQAPEVIISGNATAQSLLTPTSLDMIQVTSSGINYTASPLVAFSQGDALAQAHLNPTGVAHVHIQQSGTDYVTDPVLQFLAGEGQLGAFVNPITRVNRSFGVQLVNVITSGSGYQTEPDILFTPSTPGGTSAQAVTVISSGSGVFTIKPYAVSRDYFLVWRNQAPSSDLLRRPYADQISAVIKYFQDLGYTITPEVNPVTQNTFQWRVLW